METKWLACPLTEAEILTKADEAARLRRERDEKRREMERLADERKQMNKEADALDHEIGVLLKQVRNRSEDRRVQVEERRNDAERCMESFRLDTGELIGRRAMTLDELQGVLFEMPQGAARGLGETRADSGAV